MMTSTDNRKIENNLILDFSDDRIEAFLTIEDRGFSLIPDYGYVTDFLKKNGITTALLEHELKRMLDEKIYNTSICIARGKKSIPTVNARIIYLFDNPELRQTPDPDKPVNHRERTRIKTVSKGEAVARIIPPVPGEDGLTVTGDIIFAGKPVEKKIPTGKNLVQDANDKLLLIAAENGAVEVVSETRIDVEPVLNISGNVDYSVGNLDFTGSLIINGDIISGFSVRATGSIHVKGVIEDAVAYAGGDIFALGCAGGENGLISAGGSISIKYAENCRIQAGKDIRVDEYLMHCNVHADGNVYAIKKRGHITGGETVAFHTVEANVIGNSNEVKTVVSAGFSSELIQQFKLIDEEQTKNINNLGDVNNALKKISRFSMIKKQIPEEMKIQTRELLRMKEAIEDSINNVLDRHIDAIKNLSQTETCSVKIYGTLHPGVIINFPDKQMENKKTRTHTYIKLQNDSILISPIVNSIKQ